MRAASGPDEWAGAALRTPALGRRVTWALFCLLAGSLGGGCTGWRTSSLVQGGMERIYVPFFENATYYRGIEEKLTLEVIERIQERSDLYLADKDSAEMILEGRIADYEQKVISEDTENSVRESSATVTVDVKLVRRSDRKVLREARLRDRAEFFGARGENLASSQQESFKRLSYKILSIVEEPF